MVACSRLAQTAIIIADRICYQFPNEGPLGHSPEPSFPEHHRGRHPPTSRPGTRYLGLGGHASTHGQSLRSIGESAMAMGSVNGPSRAQHARVGSYYEDDSAKAEDGSAESEEDFHRDRPRRPTLRDERPVEHDFFVPPECRRFRLPGNGNLRELLHYYGRTWTEQASGDEGPHDSMPESGSGVHDDSTAPPASCSRRRRGHPEPHRTRHEPNEQYQPFEAPTNAPDPPPTSNHGLHPVKLEDEEPHAAPMHAPGLLPPRDLHSGRLFPILDSGLFLTPSSFELKPRPQRGISDPILQPFPSEQIEEERRFLNPRTAPVPPTTLSAHSAAVAPEEPPTASANAVLEGHPTSKRGFGQVVRWIKKGLR